LMTSVMNNLFRATKAEIFHWGVSFPLLYVCSSIKPWEGTCWALHDPEPEASSADYPCGDFSPPINLETLSKNGKTVYKKQFPRNEGFKFKGLENISTPVITKQALVIQLYPSYLTGKHERGRRSHWLQFSRWRWVRNNWDPAFWSW